MTAEQHTRRVVITGISGRLGRLLALDLHREHAVVGIDRRPFEGAPSDVTLHQLDIRSRRCEDVFRHGKVDAVVHLNIMHDPRRSAEEHHTFNVIGTQQVMEYCVRHKIPKLVVLSTANVYGPHPRSQMYLTEDAPLMASETDPQVRDLVTTDMLTCGFVWRHPEIETVVLRPVHILGTVRNAPSNYLRLPRIPKLLGFDPMIQVMHEHDVVRALRLVLAPGVRGVFNVAGPPAVPLSVLLAETGRPVLEIPHPIFESLMRSLYALRVWSFPPPEIGFLKYACLADDSRIRFELDYEPRVDLRAILQDFRTTR